MTFQLVRESFLNRAGPCPDVSVNDALLASARGVAAVGGLRHEQRPVGRVALRTKGPGGAVQPCVNAVRASTRFWCCGEGSEAAVKEKLLRCTAKVFELTSLGRGQVIRQLRTAQWGGQSEENDRCLRSTEPSQRLQTMKVFCAVSQFSHCVWTHVITCCSDSKSTTNSESPRASSNILDHGAG